MNISLKSAHNAANQQFISRKKEVFFVAIYLHWDVIISVFNVIIVLRLLTFRTQLDSFYTLSWNNEYILNTQFTNANFNTITIGISLVTFFTGNENRHTDL
ncbi:Uncharacterised protein [Neisseria meningitidis]|nr:hypothetical protein JY77_01620 [Neisseria meningitidis]CWN08755.1 Uncharacterised protein [Neisseria meningitidis]CWO72451.1 Uncharacterised protein [Neisseria meningitidis]CWP27686.1 Uncharacterised protein [Neisseria meningitidis]CWP44804.1 Uncharacterised protein [Neisseria meningitidis]